MTMGRLSRASNAVASFACVALTIAAGTAASAHRVDEYLQAARIDLRVDGVRLSLDLTPGAGLAESIIRKIDRDRDGSISAGEERAYALAVLEALELTIDGVPLSLRFESAKVPTTAALRRGEAGIRLNTSASHSVLSSGKHELFFRNRHMVGHSVYLANALVPENPRVSVTGQRRGGAQRELTIDYVVR